MLIGLHGESRAGKDTVAGVLVREYGFEQISLASAIRTMMLEINPFLYDNDGDLWQLRTMFEYNNKNWDAVKAHSAASVDFMIALGQSARDTIGERVWIDAAFNKREHWLEEDRNIVIPDIRQPNEVEFVLQEYGELWLVERPGTVKRGMDGLLKDVVWDAHIMNDGTLEDLERTVKMVMDQGI